MALCLFRLDDAPLPVEDLRSLAKREPELVSYDAPRMAERLVLAEGLNAGPAGRIQLALAELGHAVEVVSDHWLRLPRERRCRRARITSAGLVVQDTFGGEQQIDWDAVRVVAAGQAPNREDFSLALITTDPVRRYVIDPNAFTSETEGRSPLLRLASWLREVVAHAPRLTLDRQASRWLETGRPQAYATLHGIRYSLAWQLWRHHGAGAASQGDLDARTTPFVDRPDDQSFTERARARSADRVIETFAKDEATYQRKQRPKEVAYAVSVLVLGVLAARYRVPGSSWFAPDSSAIGFIVVGLGLLAFKFWQRWG